MKKLIAILLSVLMLCSVIPFAAVSVSAEDAPYIELVADAEEVNAGDEVTVEVYLYGHEDLGLIGAQVELGFDPDVFELVTYYDEDEEMWMPPIEVGPKFSASSGKYIMFPPIDEETGYMERCLVQFLRGTASASQAVKTNLFYTVTFKVKDDAVSGDYELNVINYTKNNFPLYGNDVIDYAYEPITITVNGSEPEEPSCEHEYFYACDAHCMICGELTNPEAAHSMSYVEAKPATCTVNGNIAYWTCSDCGGAWDNENATGMPLNRMMVIVPAAGHSYFDDCSAICDVCGEEREVSHNVIHVDAVAADCANDGNIEYWYCDVCGMAWLDEACTLNTNLMSVILPASCSYNAIHNEGVAAGCHYTGRLESWYCANCDVYYLDAACALITNYKSLTIPALQDTAEYVPAKAPTCDEPGNVEYWICYDCEQVWADAALTQLTNYKNVQLAPAHNVIHVEAKAATCYEPGNIEYWYCDVCGAAWTDELCREVTNLKNVVLPITHNVIHVEAKAATCFEPGNIEYWYCADCGAAWTDELCREVTNLKNVVLPIAHNVIHVEAKAATCFEPGNIEYWYCADCGAAWTDELCREVTNLKNVVLPIAHNVIHVEAKAATCFEPGNIEYWYCADCGAAWTDELCHEVTNLKNVVLPIAHNVIHVEAKAATCSELGNIEYWYCADCGSAWLDELCIYNTNLKAVVLPTIDHTYAGECDATCDACGAEREVILPAAPVAFGGNSISENKNGLAFLFTADVDGIIIGEDYKADYSDATVIINGKEHKLVGMGAIVNNKGYSAQTLENVDGTYVLNVKANKVFDAASYAIRIVNIPAEYLDTIITARSYITYECGGELITIYGEDVATSYNAELG